PSRRAEKAGHQALAGHWIWRAVELSSAQNPRVEVTEQASQLDLMEPVSVSIGAVGLLTLLMTCVECFEYIDAAKSCGRDLELLTTKFAIEKARLLIWAESVGISSTNTSGNTKVESSHVRPIVEQILNCIRMLFEDTNVLTARYGLKPAEDNASSLALTGPSGTQSIALPLRQLKASYNRFKSRIDQNQKQTSTTKKTKWAIRDKEKFTSLVEDIHQFINGLEAITNSIEMATKRAALIREEFSTVEDPEDLRLIAEACEDGSQLWSDAASIALGASVCGASYYERIREWMSANSDVQMSTVVDYAESESSSDLSETTGFPYRSHDGIGYPNPWARLAPPQDHVAHQTLFLRPPFLCLLPPCQSRFHSIGAIEQHIRNDHKKKADYWQCGANDCPSPKDKVWISCEDYLLHCQLLHPDRDRDEWSMTCMLELAESDSSLSVQTQ
ncbi:MAG: hypothetical protein Q9180_006925, partial [Flavoplaca navasiana]